MRNVHTHHSEIAYTYLPKHMVKLTQFSCTIMIFFSETPAHGVVVIAISIVRGSISLRAAQGFTVH